MGCMYVKLPDGTTAICRTSGRSRPTHCTACDQIARFLCDWKTGGGKTCDLPLCVNHAEQVGTNKHLCSKHSKVWAQWQAQRELVLKP